MTMRLQTCRHVGLAAWAAVAAMICACSPRETPGNGSRETLRAEVPNIIAAPADALAAGPESAKPPLPDAAAVRTLASALGELEGAGLQGAAAVIKSRVAQKSPKMKLTEGEAADAAQYIHSYSRALPELARLAEVMPHAAVELARATAERGVSEPDAAAIAAYLLGFIEAMRFANLRQLDINHSHVIGRAWPDIDYTGENMTWQSQQAYWVPKGVRDFKKAEHIHAYFVHAYQLPHFARVYKPAGDPADIPLPAAAE